MNRYKISSLCFVISLFFVGGCSILGTADKRPSNVAPAIAAEISSNGAGERKKPIQPDSTTEWMEDDMPSEDIDFDSESNAPSKITYEFYVVQNGDTIYGIAKKHSIPVETMMDLNGFTRETKLFVGQKIKIRKKSFGIKESASVKENAIASNIPYIVKPGDSLSRIAHEYGVSVKMLKEENLLSSDKIIVGQKLIIPAGGYKNVSKSAEAKSAEPIPSSSKSVLLSNGQYVVSHGDSLSLIARRFGVKQSDLQKSNNITNPDKLWVGQKLTIPSNNKPVEITEKPSSSVIVSSNSPKPAATTTSSPMSPRPSKFVPVAGDMYTIRSGDTIEKIAKDLGVMESDLMELNNVRKSTALQAGKKLLIPKNKIVVRSDSAVKTSSSTPAASVETVSTDFFENFEEIPVIEINN